MTLPHSLIQSPVLFTSVPLILLTCVAYNGRNEEIEPTVTELRLSTLILIEEAT